MTEKKFVPLTEKNKWFAWEKDWRYYYVFNAWEEALRTKWVVYRCLVYFNQDDFNKKLEWEKIDADLISSIKERNNDKGTWLSWMIFDNDNKQSFFVNIYDNAMKTPEKDYDKLLVLTEAEWREKWESSDKPF